jgi:putative transposon-encoded protein
MRLFKKKTYRVSAREQQMVAKAIAATGVSGETACIVMHAVRRAYGNGKNVKVPKYNVGKFN